MKCTYKIGELEKRRQAQIKAKVGWNGSVALSIRKDITVSQ